MRAAFSASARPLRIISQCGSEESGEDDTSDGCKRHRVELARELSRDDGPLVLWTTHPVDEAEETDRVPVLNEGRLVFDDTPGEALETAGAERLEDAFFRLTARRMETDD